MKYAPLPWVHLQNALHAPNRRIRLVFNEDGVTGDRAFAKLYVGPHNMPMVNVHEILEGDEGLSEREKAALNILAEAGLSRAFKGRFALTKAQVGRLLSFAADLALEIEGKGGLVQVTQPAHFKCVTVEDDEVGHAMQFIAIDDDGEILSEPEVIGEQEAMLLIEGHHLYRVAPPILPGEAQALLKSAPLPIVGLTTEEAEAAFGAVVGLGVELSELLELAIPSEPEPKIWLRALLASGMDGEGFGLRVHLVTEIQHSGIIDEVEIPARGALAPIHALYQASDKPDEGTTILVSRPSSLEEQARNALYQLGLSPAAAHRGFYAGGPKALNILAQIVAREGLPDFINVDDDCLPQVVQLPEKPILRVEQAQEGYNDLLAVRLDIGEEARHLAIAYDEIAKAAMDGQRAIALDEDTIITLSPSSGKSLEYLVDVLELKDSEAIREIGTTEFALLAASLKDKVSLACQAALLERIQSFTADASEDDHVVPDTVVTELRPYQQDGMAWMRHLHRLSLGRILADDMGLGKTLMTLAVLAWAKENQGSKPNLVVAPTSVIDVWLQEANKHVPNLNVLKWHGRERKENIKELDNVDLVVTSYALLRRDVDDALGGLTFRYIILDEAQHVKNRQTEAWKAVKQIKSEQRLALTGTPIENRVEELWSILEVVTPGLFGSERVFKKRYGIPIAKGNQMRLEELRRRCHTVILRRKKEDVASELPPKIETVYRCDMGDDQRGLYLRILAEVRSDVEQALSIHRGGRARAPILAALMRLRQTCCDPQLVLGKKKGAEVSSAKRALFAEIIRECIASDRRVVVFSQFVKMQEIIHEVLKEEGIQNALWLHGGSKNRGDIVANFQKEDGPPVIVVSLKAGGTGVTLTAADTVIHYDPWWNPAVEDQATDRAHRIGQEKPVHVIRLACEDTIEERMLALAADKRLAAESVLSKDAPGPRSLSLDEIKNLLDLEALSAKAPKAAS